MGASNDPVYLRVLEDLRDQIRGGSLAPGARVPSRNGIIARYGVGETAAKHALQVLAAEGLIEARAGSGSYVRRLPVAAPLEHDRLHFPGSPFGLAGRAMAGNGVAGDGVAGNGGAADGAAADGAAADDGAGADHAGHASRVSWEYQSERVAAPAHVARRLRLPDGDHLVTRTRYLMSADGSPVQLATSYEPAAATAQTPVRFPEQGTFAGRGVAERMQAIGIGVDQVVEEISVRPALSAEAAVLGIPAGSPVLLIERSHRSGERTVETGEIVVAADRFRLRYRFPVALQPDPAPATPPPATPPPATPPPVAPPPAGLPAAAAPAGEPAGAAAGTRGTGMGA
jgi:GntR family transcriptional regulator